MNAKNLFSALQIHPASESPMEIHDQLRKSWNDLSKTAYELQSMTVITAATMAGDTSIMLKLLPSAVDRRDFIRIVESAAARANSLTTSDDLALKIIEELNNLIYF